jgi:hypothetical protein
MRSITGPLPKAGSAKPGSSRSPPTRNFDSPTVLEKIRRTHSAPIPTAGRFSTGAKGEIAALAGGSLKLSAQPVKPAEQQNAADLFIHTTLFVIVDKHAQLRGYFETGGDGVDWTNAVRPRNFARRPPTGNRAMTLHDLPAVNATPQRLERGFSRRSALSSSSAATRLPTATA